MAISLRTKHFRDAQHLARVADAVFVRFFRSAVRMTDVRAILHKHLAEALADDREVHLATRHGRPVGNPNGAQALAMAGKGNEASLRTIKETADTHAFNLKPVVQALAEEGKTSLGAVANALNERGMLTPRGGRWHKITVRNLFDRLGYS
jgi:hypothetical protein